MSFWDNFDQQQNQQTPTRSKGFWDDFDQRGQDTISGARTQPIMSLAPTTRNSTPQTGKGNIFGRIVETIGSAFKGPIALSKSIAEGSLQPLKEYGSELRRGLPGSSPLITTDEQGNTKVNPEEFDKATLFSTNFIGSAPLNISKNAASTAAREFAEQQARKAGSKVGSEIAEYIPRAKNIHPEDLSEMRDFADYFKGSMKVSDNTSMQIDTDIRRIAQRYGFIDNPNVSNQVIYNRVAPVLDDLLEPRLLEKPSQLPVTSQTPAPRTFEPIRGEGGRFNGSRSREAGFVNPGEVVEDVAQGYKTFKTEFIDRYSPVEELVKGKNLSIDSDPYVAMRNFAGHTGKIENRLDELSQILTPVKKDLNDIKEYLTVERFLEDAKLGIKNFEGGIDEAGLKAKKAAIETKLGPEGMARIKPAIDQYYKFQDNNLQYLVDGGIVSREGAEKMRANRSKYSPVQRVMNIVDNADNIPAGRSSFSVSKQNVIYKTKGSIKKVLDPLEATVKNIHKTVSLVERNKAALKVADLSNLPEFKDVIIKITDGITPPGMEKISVFRNGVKEEYAVPKGVGEAMKALNQQAVDLVTRVARKGAAALRAGATTLNIAFIPTNIIRDFQTATIVSKVGFTPIDWIRGFAEGIRGGAVYKDFLEYGGSSGFFEGQKSISKSVKQLTQGKTLKYAKTILNPLELIRLIGEVTELAPRLGVYSRSIRKGVSGTEAAFNARNATVDFNKAGNTMKVLNMWVPFLNARLQGTVNMFGAIRKNKVSSFLKLTAMVGVPVAATYIHNQANHKEVWDDISQTEKDSNFIIIYGDEVDDKGNPTQVVKIPKGDIKIFANPLENFIHYLNGKDSKSMGVLGFELMSNVSPVEFMREGEVSALPVASSLTPPTAKGILEWVTNKNFFTGRDIVSDSMIDASPEQQYNDRTSNMAIWLGGKLGVSPAKLENFVGTQFGGVGRQVLDPGKINTSVTSRFSGARGGEQENKIEKEAKQFLQEQTDNKLNILREAQKELEYIENSSDPAAQFERLRTNNKEVAKKVVELKEKKDLGFTSKDYTISDLGVENGQRAAFLVTQFNKLTTDDEKAELWEELTQKKLITDQVAKQITKILNGQNPQ